MIPRLSLKYLFVGITTVVVFFTSGCVIRTYHEGSTTYRSIAILASGSVAPFTLEAGKIGDPTYRRLDSKGVVNDTNAAIDAAVTAAVRAAKTP